MVDEIELSVVKGLLEIARYALPDTWWETDSRVDAARHLLGSQFPSDDELHRRFRERRPDLYPDE